MLVDLCSQDLHTQCSLMTDPHGRSQSSSGNTVQIQVRSLSVLEGIALASDPNYKVLGATYPWIARRLLTDRSPELRVSRAPAWHFHQPSPAMACVGSCGSA